MDRSDVLDCAVYVDSEKPTMEGADIVGGALGGSVRSRGATSEVRLPIAEMEVRRNQHANLELAQQFPDGFLHFRCVIEIYFSPDCLAEERIALASKVLEVLWSLSLPAVAACDFEDKLPRGGGYKN